MTRSSGVDVKARLDEGSADQVEHRLRDKLKDSTAGISDGLKDLGGSIKAPSGFS
jgi:hypothetical protein